MPLIPGTRLGPYEIVTSIGAGGMGEVYRATDSNLKRSVAIKVLPAAVAGDADRLARFQREAEVLAALNHPNIAAIYGVEKTPDFTALVMELVEGEDLSTHLSRGPMPLAEALPVAKQIADALEAAHERGIIHRDLKPANIKVRADGTVKVLDFGLAKVLDANAWSATADAMNSPTITSPARLRQGYGEAGTAMGMILGTAAYMAPEQAKGRTVDRRADVWAFGAVLYEMLSGHRAFSGGDVSDTLANVLKAEPDWSRLPAAAPSRVRLALRACLQKDPKQRLGDVQSVRLALEGAFETVQPRAQQRGYLPWAVAAGSAALTTALIVWMAIRPQSAAELPIARVLLGVGPAERLLSGYSFDSSAGQGRPSRTSMAFSPDGRSLVFSAEREGRVQLYLRRLDQLDAIPLAGTEGASNPFFSPDGQSLGFHAAGALRKVPVGGGPVVELCKTDPESPFPSPILGASWSHKGQIVFANTRGGLWQVPAAGGTPAALTKPRGDTGEISHRLPQVLPDGETVLFTVTLSTFPSWNDTLVVAQSLTTGARKVLIEGAADARLVSTGHLVYLRKGTLMAVPFDLRRLEVTGPAVGVVSDVMQAADIQPLQIDSGAGQFAVSNAGALVYATGGVFSPDRWSLVWVDRTGRSDALRVPPGAYHFPRLSPDGRRVAFNSTAGDWDVWTYEIQRGIAARVALEGQQSGPVWTPDSSRLVFSSRVGSDFLGPLLLIDPDGRSPAERLTQTSVTGLPGSWTPDGRALAFTFFGPQAGIGIPVPSIPRNEIWVALRDGKTEPRQLLSEGRVPEFSADGRWLAYTSGTPPQVYVQPYPALDRRAQVSTHGGINPAWRRDGREMYYLQNVSAGGALKIRVMAVPVTTTPAFSAGTPHLLFEGPFRADGPARTYDVTHDGQRFLMVQEVQRPPARVSQMVLVQNWVEELKRLAPPR